MTIKLQNKIELDETFREFVGEDFSLLEDKKPTEKQILQSHLNNEFGFSHRIDVEPTPYHPINRDELHQRFRKILFDINKKYLRSKYFPKWRHEDKFWIFGCKQGDGVSVQKHYHLLLHSPLTHRISIWDDLVFPFISKSSTNPRNGKVRKTMSYYKDKYHIGADDMDTKFLINAEPVRTHTGSVRYNTRKVHPKMEDGEDCFVIGLRE
jgi:hypothetical protein